MLVSGYTTTVVAVEYLYNWELQNLRFTLLQFIEISLRLYMKLIRILAKNALKLKWVLFCFYSEYTNKGGRLKNFQEKKKRRNVLSDFLQNHIYWIHTCVPVSTKWIFDPHIVKSKIILKT